MARKSKQAQESPAVEPTAPQPSPDHEARLKLLQERAVKLSLKFKLEDDEAFQILWSAGQFDDALDYLDSALSKFESDPEPLKTDLPQHDTTLLVETLPTAPAVEQRPQPTEGQAAQLEALHHRSESLGWVPSPALLDETEVLARAGDFDAAIKRLTEELDALEVKLRASTEPHRREFEDSIPAAVISDEQIIRLAKDILTDKDAEGIGADPILTLCSNFAARFNIHFDADAYRKLGYVNFPEMRKTLLHLYNRVADERKLTNLD